MTITWPSPTRSPARTRATSSVSRPRATASPSAGARLGASVTACWSNAGAARMSSASSSSSARNRRRAGRSSRIRGWWTKPKTSSRAGRHEGKCVDAEIRLKVDGEEHCLAVDTRTTLLDALRERLGNTSPKKGCDHGQCGACTVLLDGERALSCLALAVAHDGAEITTADGLAPDGELHPVQRAFLDRDAFQCGYCTPGQICSAVGVLDEVRSGMPSAATVGVTGEVELDEAEIAERMSGNLCRCGAYL